MKLKKVYWDMLESEKCTTVFSNEVEIIPAGTTLYSMSVKDKNREYQKYADTYDLRFIFDDDVPIIEFYTVPRIDIFAKDSLGGLFGTIGDTTDIDNVAPVCYINKNQECFSVAYSLKDFIQMLVLKVNWKMNMALNSDIVFYKSKADAERSLEFLEIYREQKNRG